MRPIARSRIVSPSGGTVPITVYISSSTHIHPLVGINHVRTALARAIPQRKGMNMFGDLYLVVHDFRSVVGYREIVLREDTDPVAFAIRRGRIIYDGPYGKYVPIKKGVKHGNPETRLTVVLRRPLGELYLEVITAYYGRKREEGEVWEKYALIDDPRLVIPNTEIDYDPRKLAGFSNGRKSA